MVIVNGFFVTVGVNLFTNKTAIKTSKDGINRTVTDVPVSLGLRGVIYGDAGFYASGIGIYKLPFDSPWIKTYDSGPTDLWTSIAFNGLYVAVGKPGAIMVSP